MVEVSIKISQDEWDRIADLDNEVMDKIIAELASTKVKVLASCSATVNMKAKTVTFTALAANTQLKKMEADGEQIVVRLEVVK